MTLLSAAKPGTGDLLYVLRLVFGCALIACLVLGFAAIRRRNIPAHRAWMIRAYAIALAAGTQAFTQGLGGVVLGTGSSRVISPRAPAGSSTSPSPNGSSAAPPGSGVARSLDRPDRALPPWGHADDRRQHSYRVLTYVACMQTSTRPSVSTPARTSLDVAHPLASA